MYFLDYRKKFSLWLSQLDQIQNPGLSKTEMALAKKQERERQRKKKARRKQRKKEEEGEGGGVVSSRERNSGENIDCGNGDETADMVFEEGIPNTDENILKEVKSQS